MNEIIVPVVAGVLATLAGIPVARWLEETTYRKPDEVDEPSPGRRWWVPPTLGVVVGLLVYLLLSRAGPLGELGLLFTPTAMVIAQAILVTPIIAGLSRQVLASDTLVATVCKLVVHPLAALGIGMLLALPAEAVFALVVLAAIPEVLEVHTITGAGDLWARVVARSNADLQRVIDRVLEAPAIVRSSTVICRVLKSRSLVLSSCCFASRVGAVGSKPRVLTGAKPFTSVSALFSPQPALARW